MRRLSDHDSSRSWGPQSTAIPVGGSIAWIVGAAALLFGVASEVPEVQMWVTLALPASLVISLGYIVVRRWRSQPPTALNLQGAVDSNRVADKTAPPRKGFWQRRYSLQNALASR